MISAKRELNFILGVLSVLAFVACQSPQRSDSEDVQIEDVIEGAPQAPAVKDSEGPEQEATLPQDNEVQESGDVDPAAGTDAFFGVWIEGVGYDAFAALGFLQSLSKAGLEPAFVVGTGMGCWAAMSWAYQANANQAEWQAFKFNRWAGLEKSWLSKVGLHNSMTEFTTYIAKNMEAKQRKDFALPFECPLLPKGSDYTLKAARGLELPVLMWRQLQVPSLGGDPEKSSTRWLSGAFAGQPSEQELKAFARLLIKDRGVKSFKDKKFLGWLILKTSRAGDLLVNNEGMQKLLTRSEPYRQKQSMAGAFPWVRLDLSDPQARPSQVIKEAVKRRAWMLKGRNYAKSLLGADNSTMATGTFWQLIQK